MRVLITGGAGFIGSHTAEALLADNHEVRVLDSLTPPVHEEARRPAHLDDRVELVVGDVRDPRLLLDVLRGCDVVVHLAAFQDQLPTFSRYFDVNATSTALLFELVVRERLPIQKVIVASSQAVLGEGLYLDADGVPFLPDMRSAQQLAEGVWPIQAPAGRRGPISWQPTDESVANPQNPYGLSKLAEELVALQIGRRYEIPVVALRYSIVQGPRQSFRNAYSGACRVFCLNFHVGRLPTIYEDGQQVRDFVNIADVVDANLLVLEDPRADFEVFHVGGGRAITVNEFAAAVAEVYGRRDYQPVPVGKYRFGDTRHILSDISKLTALGWSPRRSVYDSIEAYKSWLDHTNATAAILDHFDEQLEVLDVVRAVTPT